MARLTIWILLLAVIYSGYWFAATRAFQQALTNAITDARQNGWQIDYDTLDTTGFPGDFDLSAVAMDIVAADGRWAWQAPDLQVQAPSIQPTQVNVAFPNTQTLRMGNQTLRIESDALAIDAGTRLNAALSFDNAAINATEASVVSDLGWQISLDRALATMRRQPEGDRAYDLDVNASGVTIPAATLSQFAPDGTLTNTIDTVTLDGEVTLNRALNRFAFDGNGEQPALERIVLTGFDMIWGDIAVNASGALDVDGQGVPDGRIIIKTAEWQAIIDLLVATGAIDSGVAPTLTNMANTMVDDSGMLELPVTFRDGFMSMGLLPLGPAPRLR